MLLALDTASSLVTVALHSDGAVLASATSQVPMKHGELLAPMIAEALRSAGADRRDLTSIAVGVGPGPFTGLRVGVVTALTLGHVLGIDVHGVCSLDALAGGAVAAGVDRPFTATLDARRKELFWASYDEQGRRLAGPSVSRPADLVAELADGMGAAGGALVVGAGPVLYPDAFAEDQVAGPAAVDAAVMADLVARGQVELLHAEPIYLRRPDATIPGPAKKVS